MNDDTDFTSDIPLALAVAAHSGISFSPEKRGAARVEEYAGTLAEDLAEWRTKAEQHGTTDALDTMFPIYRERFKAAYLAMLQASSRCVSTMIAGGSKFPVRQMEKRSDTHHRRLNEMLAVREKWRKRILKAICPQTGGPILTGDGDAVERLEEKLAKLVGDQERMRATNAAIRKHAKAGREAQLAALEALQWSSAAAHRLLLADDCGRVGFPDYRLSNINAEIHRLRARLAQVTAAKEADGETLDFNGVTYEDSPADNRVRLFFPGKPDGPTRDRLKGHGFRWAPSLGCWQAFRNPRSIQFAKGFVKGGGE